MYGQLSYDMEVSLSCSSPACRIQPVKRHQRHAPFFETKLLFFQFTLCFIIFNQTCTSWHLTRQDLHVHPELPTLPREKLPGYSRWTKSHAFRASKHKRLSHSSLDSSFSSWGIKTMAPGSLVHGRFHGPPEKKMEDFMEQKRLQCWGCVSCVNWLSSNKNVTLLVNFRTFNCYFSFGIPFRHLLWVENRNLGTGTVYTA